MVLSQKIHGTFKSAVERMTGPRTVSAFKEKGVLQDQDRAAWLYQAMIARKRHSQVTLGSFNFVNSVCDLSACSVDSKEESSCLSTGSSEVSTTASRIKLINQKSYEKLRVPLLLRFKSGNTPDTSKALRILSCVLESVAYSYRLTVLIKPSSTIILDKQCAFKEKGVLSVSEFVLASDNLVFKCPTWSCLQYFLIPFCTPATEREKTVREMAAKREFLDLTGIPFTRGLLLPPLSSHCNLFFLIIHALLSSSSINMFSLVISVAGNSSVEYSCGSRTR
ncbi:unnamed protein product [Brassica oleracea var. botrytis]|uniref:(rape) hypothetical protein n=1 Tax=Brassica napus TaxID=3708 RepID=A0A816JWK0_BRANA|nr:unnamed protein product [Brassica napus]